MPKLWEHLAGSIIARCIYFIGTAVALPVLTAIGIGMTHGRNTTYALEGAAPLYSGTVLSPFPTSPYWLTVLCLALLVALFGPQRLRPWRRRESARLDAIEEASEMRVNEVEPKGAAEADPLQPNSAGSHNGVDAGKQRAAGPREELE